MRKSVHYDHLVTFLLSQNLTHWDKATLCDRKKTFWKEISAPLPRRRKFSSLLSFITMKHEIVKHVNNIFLCVTCVSATYWHSPVRCDVVRIILSGSRRFFFSNFLSFWASLHLWHQLLLAAWQIIQFPVCFCKKKKPIVSCMFSLVRNLCPPSPFWNPWRLLLIN